VWITRSERDEELESKAYEVVFSVLVAYDVVCW
jgi:hypothetical protein